jgi:hypothetical protein
MKKEPVHNSEKQITGRFKAGQSGNPAGRPKGSVNLITRAAQEKLAERADEILEQAISLAASGDIHALKLLIPRLLPEVREQPFPVLDLPQIGTVEDLPAFADAVLEAVSSGAIPPITAGQLMDAAKLKTAALSQVQAATDWLNIDNMFGTGGLSGNASVVKHSVTMKA